MPSATCDILRFDRHRLDIGRQQLWTGTEPVALQPKAWALLLYLLERPGVLVSTDELLTALWPRSEVTHKALTNRIVELRKALGDQAHTPRLIQTVHRRGYRLLAEVRRGGDPDGADTGPRPQALPAAAGKADRAVLADLAGRADERAALAGHWARSVQGERQLVLVTGESGMGKTSLVEAVVRDVLAEDARAVDTAAVAASPAGLLLGRGASLALSTEREAFGPLLALVADLAAGPDQSLVVGLLRRFAPSWLLQLPWLSDADTLAQWRRHLTGAGHGRMLREGCAFLEALAQQRPLLLLLEDLHWADPATLDLLDQLAQGRRPARLMVLATLRPALPMQARSPTLARAHDLVALGRMVQRALGPLTLPEVQAHLAARFGSAPLAHALASRVMRASAGHPLFLAAWVDHLLATGRLRQAPQGWVLQGADDDGAAQAGTADALDLAAQAFLAPMRRLVASALAQLEPAQRALLEAASVVGMQVSAQALAAALGQAVEDVEQACQALQLRQPWLLPRPALAWPDGSVAGAWTFVHDVHRQVLYDAMAPARRQLLHRRVADRLVRGWGGRMGEQAGALAAAYAQADMPAATAQMLELVAGVCARRYAYADAADAIHAALVQLARLPPSEARDRHELRLQLSHADLLMAHRGLNFPRILRAFRTAEALSLRLGEVRQQVRARLGICLHHVLCAWPAEAVAASEGLVALAQVQQPAQLAAVHAYTGLAQLLAGRAGIAHDHFVQALAAPPEPVEAPLLDIHALAGVQRVRCLLALGRPQEAGSLVDAALAHARRVCVPMDLTQNLFWVADCLCRLDRSGEAGVLLDEMVTLAEAQALPHYRIAGEVCRLGLAPPARRDLPRMEALLQQLLASGERWCDARLLALLAETRQARGDAVGARQALAQAEALLAGMPVHASDVARARERLAQS